MKLLDILEALNKPEQIYTPGQEPEETTSDISKLTSDQQRKIFQQGFVTIGSDVIYLPKLEKKRKDISQNRREFKLYQYHPENEIKTIAKDIDNLYGQLYNKINELNNKLKLKKQTGDKV